MVVSDRGAGKTYGTLKWALQRYEEKGEQFVYLRRTMIEIENVEPVLLKALEADGVFPPKKYFCKGKVIYERTAIEKEEEEIEENTLRLN